MATVLEPSDTDGLQPLTAILGMARLPVRMACPGTGFGLVDQVSCRFPTRPAITRTPFARPPKRRLLVTREFCCFRALPNLASEAKSPPTVIIWQVYHARR